MEEDDDEFFDAVEEQSSRLSGSNVSALEDDEEEEEEEKVETISEAEEEEEEEEQVIDNGFHEKKEEVEDAATAAATRDAEERKVGASNGVLKEEESEDQHKLQSPQEDKQEEEDDDENLEKKMNAATLNDSNLENNNNKITPTNSQEEDNDNPSSSTTTKIMIPKTPPGPLTCLPSSPLESILLNANCCPSFTASMFHVQTADPKKPPTASPDFVEKKKKRMGNGGGGGMMMIQAKESGETTVGEEEEEEEEGLPPVPPLLSQQVTQPKSTSAAETEKKEDNDEEEEEETDDGASSTSSSLLSKKTPSSPSHDADSIFRIVNKDTGEIIDIREYEANNTTSKTSSGIDTAYTLFPSKEFLFQTRTNLMEDHDDNKEKKKGGGEYRHPSVTKTYSYDSNTVGSISTKDDILKSDDDDEEEEEEEVSSAGGKKKRGRKMMARMKSMKNKVKDKMKTAAAKSPKRPGATTTTTTTKNNPPVPPPLDTVQTKEAKASTSSLLSSSPKRTKQKKLKSPTSLDTLPCNSIQVKQFQKPMHQTEYNPLLLIKSLPKAHDGPIWCLSFSCGETQKYLASGGEDGVICIWAVAPMGDMWKEEEKLWEMEEEEKKMGGGEEEEEEEGEGLAPPPVMIGNACELGTEIQILSSKPIRRYTDHTEHVIDFSWSATNFLLSASLDKTVRLWHVSRPGCLQIFQHADLVTAVAFHPRDDGYFLSGGSDKKLRVWSILDGRVKDWAQAPEMITAARYTPDGRFVVAGLLHGQVYFYDVDGLKYYTQIACRNRHGSQKEGKKVTGLTFMRGAEHEGGIAKATAGGGGDNGSVDRQLTRGGAINSSMASIASSSPENSEESLVTPKAATRSPSRLKYAVRRNNGANKKVIYKDKMLVTTNDSRLRLYGLDDFCMIRKYKGLVNMQMQIRARFNETGDYIVCGSEGGNVYIWNTATKSEPLHLKVGGMHNYDRSKSYESFEASQAALPIVTDTVFVPSRGLKEALKSSKLFPSLLNMDNVQHDMSSAAIITCDYEGTMRVFMRKACIDAVYHSAGPDGFRESWVK